MHLCNQVNVFVCWWSNVLSLINFLIYCEYFKLQTKSTYYSSSLIQDELKSNLKLQRNCSEGINYLLLKLFSIDELVTSSVMGVSTKKGQRKGLNEEKRSLIESNFTIFLIKAIYMSFIFLHWSLNEYATDFRIIYHFLILQV